MGIIYVLKRVTDDEVALLRTQPEQAVYLVMGDSFKPRPTTPAPGFLQRLMGKTPPAPESFPAPAHAWTEDEESELDLDKSWDPINILLTRGDYESPWPSQFLIADDKVIYGGEDGEQLDFPVLAFNTSEVRAIADLLDSVSREDLAERFDPEMLSEWDMDWLAEDPDEQRIVLDTFDEMRRFIRQTVDAGSGLVGILS